jgi:hypothetical protein
MNKCASRIVTLFLCTALLLPDHQSTAYIAPILFGVHHAKKQFRAGTRQAIQDPGLLDGEVSKLLISETSSSDDLEIVEKYTSLAIEERGTPAGLDALQELAKLCQRRIPYEFEDREKGRGTVVAPLPKMLSPRTVETFLEQVREIEANGWLSTNPDSVDGLPSLHLNLISGGKPIVDPTRADLNDFQTALSNLLGLVKPQLYDILLPEVNRLMNSTSISISEVFLRRYGQEICGGVTRNGISAHYDVFSRVTSVIALDDVAASGTNGLYTTYISHSGSSPSQSGSSSSGSTSNHAALRRFFPLKCGDGVVHTWDVLHGVDVEPGLDRTSLIVWFTDGNEDPTVSPAWLTDHADLEINDVVQFVLGSALSSLEEPGAENDGKSTKDTADWEHELYLQSAMQGNAFALTRLGSLFEEGVVSSELRQKAQASMKLLQRSSDLPAPICQIPIAADEGMAMRCWLKGALKGNHLAQRALADDLTFLTSQSGDSDCRLLASVLFALAAQQGCPDSIECLSRLIEFDLVSRGVETEEDNLASPVVMTAKAALIQAYS